MLQEYIETNQNQILTVLRLLQDIYGIIQKPIFFRNASTKENCKIKIVN